MLDAEQWRNNEMIAKGRVLNDVVINKAALARIFEITVNLDGLFCKFVSCGRTDRIDANRFNRL